MMNATGPRSVITRIQQILLVALLQTVFFVIAAPAADIDYRSDPAFERRIRSVNATCMPAPYILVEKDYAYRLLQEAFDECVTGNTTDAQVRKYTYVITRALIDPATATYTGGELLSDGAKCVSKTFVDASYDLNPSEKAKIKTGIDGVFVVKDWVALLLGIPDMSSPNKAKATEATMNTLLSLRDRAPEIQSFNDAVMAAATHSQTYLSDLFLGERLVALNAAEYNTEYCRYGDARLYLEQARKATDAECVQAGHSYRQRELNLRTHINENRDRLQTSLGDGEGAKETYNLILGNLEAAKRRLEYLVENYQELDQLERELEKSAKKFSETQLDYRFLIRWAREDLDDRHVCNRFDALNDKLADIPQKCRPVFFSTPDLGDDMVPPDVLATELYQLEQRRKTRWWAEVEEIATLFRQCREDEGYGRISDLQSRINANPIAYAMGGQCKTLESQDLRDKLNSFTKMDHCVRTTVPRIEGEKLSEAIRMLEKASLYQGGSSVMVDPIEGQEGGIVIASDPAQGDSVKVWTAIELTVTREPAKEDETDLVNVPEVIGQTETTASDRVAGAGLVAAIDRSKPADKPDLVPGMVYGASPAQGTPLARGSEVVLNVYGARPMIEIPGIAGPDVQVARDKLTAAGFVAGKAAMGKPAPDDADPGFVYGSTPAQGNLAEMFSTVQPLVYGLRPVAAASDPEDTDTSGDTRAIPPVLGHPVKEAIGMLTRDGFFTVSSISPGNPVKDDEIPGTVQTVIPAEGTPQVRGTTVELRLAMERTKPAPPPAPDNTPAQVQPDVDDNSWIGRWRVDGMPGQTYENTGEYFIIDIARIDDRLSLKLIVQKKGVWEERFALSLMADGNNVLRVHPAMIRELTSGQGQSQSSDGGVVGDVGRKIGDAVVQALETLAISRVDNVCTLSVTDTKKGPQTMRYKCVKTGPSQQ